MNSEEKGMEFKTAKEYTCEENQQRTRSKLLACLRNKPKGYRAIAAESGLHYITIFNFINGMRATFKTLSMVDNWLDKQEEKK